MPISTKSKSPRGTNGPEEMQLEEEILNSSGLTPSLESESIPEPTNPSPEPVEDAPVAEDSGKPSPYSATDLKLATKMNRAIARSLGLSGKSRSVII